MITPEQLRAARGFLDWTRLDCAEAARISPETVKNIEHGAFKRQEGTEQALLDTFNAKGVQFISVIIGPYRVSAVLQTSPAKPEGA
jgi:transcriptional regulator with XRE-family HTH domain